MYTCTYIYIYIHAYTPVYVITIRINIYVNTNGVCLWQSRRIRQHAWKKGSRAAGRGPAAFDTVGAPRTWLQSYHR